MTLAKKVKNIARVSFGLVAGLWAIGVYAHITDHEPKANKPKVEQRATTKQPVEQPKIDPDLQDRIDNPMEYVVVYHANGDIAVYDNPNNIYVSDVWDTCQAEDVADPNSIKILNEKLGYCQELGKMAGRNMWYVSRDYRATK